MEVIFFSSCNELIWH